MTSKPQYVSTGASDMLLPRHRQERAEKVVVVLGATGTGKSRLSIDLATRYPGEIINSDKIQMYKGLDALTNKITDEESRGVPHHLLSILDDPAADFSAANFRSLAAAAITSILGRGKLPIIAGGSNSFIEALFEDKESQLPSRYQCSYLWMDVSMPVLHSYLSHRVDQMVKKGMVAEIAKIYTQNSDYTKGVRRSIGVPEFDAYFRAINSSLIPDEKTLANILEEAINKTKINTCILACRQREKIVRMSTVKGWKIHRIDATQVFEKRGEEAEKAWEKLVLVPSSRIVSRFLFNNKSNCVSSMAMAMAVPGPKVAATPGIQ